MNLITRYLFRFFRFKVKVLIVAGLCMGLAFFLPEAVPVTEAQTLPALEVPKIYVGQDFFEKREIFRYEKTEKQKSIPYVMPAPKPGERVPPVDKDELELNDINGIYTGEIDDQKGTDILAAGDRKAFILDLGGKVKRVIDYNLGNYFDDGVTQSYNLPFITFADLDKDGKVEIIGNGVGIGAILNLKGKILWKYKITKEYTDPDDIVIDDLDGDGKNEILVAIENRLEVYDPVSQKMKWTAEFVEETYLFLTWGRLKIADFDGDGKREILAGETLLDTNGKVIRKLKSFFLFFWIGMQIQNNKTPLLLDFDKNKLIFTDLDKKVIKSYEAPLSDLKRKPRMTGSGGYSLFNAQAISVRLFNEERTHLAVLADGSDDEEFDSFKMLYIYNPDGNLVYQETFKAFGSEICVLTNGDGTESLLITDEGKVNLYRVK